jgi:uncharacterized protein
LQYGHHVEAIGLRAGTTEGITIHKGKAELNDIHTVTLYMNPTNQEPYLDYIASLKPQRVIFNPGTENPKLQDKLTENGIDWEESCTLVMLRSRQF